MVAGLAYVTTGVVASRYSSPDGRRHARSHWPQVRGIITDSKVAINGRDEPPNWIITNWFEGRPHWDITGRLTYVVYGVQCTAEQRWYSSSNDRAGAQEERLRYLAGESVTVYYNLENPTRAVIESAKPARKESDVEFTAKCAGSVLGVLGTLILAWRLGWL